MKRPYTVLIIQLMLFCFLSGCSSMAINPKKSSADIATQRLTLLPKPPPRQTAQVSSPPIEMPPLPFEVYTWQPQNGKIMFIGKGLQHIRFVKIGKIKIIVKASSNGRSAVGRYPREIKKDMSIVIPFEGLQIVLPERFSPSKPGKLPRIRQCTFAWKSAQVPGRIEIIGGKQVTALRFVCTVEGFVPRNASVTAFIGSVVIPNDQINDEKKRITGYVYRPDRLEECAPVFLCSPTGRRVMHERIADSDV